MVILFSIIALIPEGAVFSVTCEWYRPILLQTADPLT